MRLSAALILLLQCSIVAIFLGSQSATADVAVISVNGLDHIAAYAAAFGPSVPDKHHALAGNMRQVLTACVRPCLFT